MNETCKDRRRIASRLTTIFLSLAVLAVSLFSLSKAWFSNTSYVTASGVSVGVYRFVSISYYLYSYDEDNAAWMLLSPSTTGVQLGAVTIIPPVYDLTAKVNQDNDGLIPNETRRFLLLSEQSFNTIALTPSALHSNADDADISGKFSFSYTDDQLADQSISVMALQNLALSPILVDESTRADLLLNYDFLQPNDVPQATSSLFFSEFSLSLAADVDNRWSETGFSAQFLVNTAP